MGRADLEWRGRLGSPEMDTLFRDAWGGATSRHDVVSQLSHHSLGWVTAREARGNLVGFINVAWDGGLHAFLLDATVVPRFQRTGLGKRLVDMAIDRARKAGCKWLHVDFEAGLAHFYLDACGFVPTDAGLIDLKA